MTAACIAHAVSAVASTCAAVAPTCRLPKAYINLTASGSCSNAASPSSIASRVKAAVAHKLTALAAALHLLLAAAQNLAAQIAAILLSLTTEFTSVHDAIFTQHFLLYTYFVAARCCIKLQKSCIHLHLDLHPTAKQITNLQGLHVLLHNGGLHGSSRLHLQLTKLHLCARKLHKATKNASS